MTQAIPRSTETMAPAKWSLDEFHSMITAGVLDDRRVELLNGLIVDMPQGDPNHTGCREDVAEYLKTQLGDLAKVRHEALVTLPDPNNPQNSSEPAPDISVVRPGKYRKQNPHPEDIYLLIEVANTHPQRAREKRLIYAQAGIQEYWIFELDKEWMRVLRDVQNGDYQTEMVWQADIIHIQALPAISINAQELKRVAFDT